MKNSFSSSRAFGILFLFLICLTILLSETTTIQDNPPENCNLPPLKENQKEGDPKIESVLYRLLQIYFSSGISEAKKFGEQRDIYIEGDSIRVVIDTNSVGTKEEIESRVYITRKQIEALGGKIETAYKNSIQSLVPIYILQDLTNMSLIKYVRLPLKPIPCVISEGVAKTGASQWQILSPYKSTEEVKVCILDVGFKGYKNLLGTELPSNVETKSFRTDLNIGAHDHGTACAEIVHDMAPDAKLLLVNFDTDIGQHNAVDWIIKQGVDIISYSIGWNNAGAGDGTGPICEDVKKAANNGIVWASAAGNEANNHWEGNFRDSDKDKWHNFFDSDEILHFYVWAYNAVSVSLNWNDWGNWNGTYYRGSNQDYDLFLYYWTGTNWIFVDKSVNGQNGTQWPTEFIGYWYSKIPAYWGIAIRKYRATKNVKLEVFMGGNSGPIEYNNPNGSLLIPADSSHAMAAGATDWLDDSYHSYSSRGPTSDGRVKPDFCAPSGVSGFTYGYYGFYGTSAATPHLAGAFALLKRKTPYSLEQINNIIEWRAVDLGLPGKDNKYGMGRIKLIK